MAIKVWAFVVGLLAAFGLGYFTSWQLGLLAVFLLVVVLRINDIWLSIRTFRRDITGAIRYWKCGIHLSFISWRNKTVPMIFHEQVMKHPNSVMLVEGDREWTYSQVDEFTNRMANYFLGTGLKSGDDVALVMENRVDIILVWLAMSKIGVVTALINYNLRRAPLLHCVTAVDSKAVIFSPKMASNVLEVRSDLVEKLPLKFYAYGASELIPEFPAENLLPALEKTPSTLPQHRGSLEDKLIYIYTSGTTGMPKAAVIKHLRFIYIGLNMNYMLPLNKSDVLYACLPLYHLSGAMATSQSILTGNKVVVAPKFSASTFWTDCIKYKCTVSQYIGETCRYLCCQPVRETDKQHNVKLMFGNGLRPQVWTEFVSRFGVKNVREVYGSTEGNAYLMNLDNKVGAIGFLPTLCRHIPFLAPFLFNLEIIKLDPETREPLRGSNGLCMRAKPGELGEIVARIKRRTFVRFDGYTDNKATSKKIYTDVLRKGDQCFSSGDAVVYDNLGYIYFKDRMGDTFRWRGENVSTAEVEATITKHINAQDSVVFGVEVAGSEGRAGMAVLVDPDQKTDLGDLLKKMRADLPAYSIPLFIRLTKAIELTSTFKLKKVDLLKEGYDVTKINDPLFFFDRTVDAYVPLDAELYAKIVNMQIKV